MSISTSVMTDQATRAAVQEELEWTPDVDAAGIGVAVEDGTVSLSGEVDSYAEQLAAKRAALRVRGVRAIVDNLEVHPRSAWPVTETDIAKEVERALRRASEVPDGVKAEIKNRIVTLRGTVDWEYQRLAANRAVQHLRGVKSVINLIGLAARPSRSDTAERVTQALVRNAQLDAKAIDVKVVGTTVTLTGNVRSWAERQQAEHAAWASPHVSHVENRLVVRAFSDEGS